MINLKKFRGLAFSAALLGLLGVSVDANAVDFKIRGLYQFGFALNETALVTKYNGKRFQKPISNDMFKARQRFRVQLDAIASESLSGSLQLEIGHIRWGQSSTGGEFGANREIVKVRQAYLDWMPPDSDLKVRMGVQNFTLPNAAGGSNVLSDTNLAGVVANYAITENVGLSAMWFRPFNDNFSGWSSDGYSKNNQYLDNMDLFALAVPLKFDGVELTPWAMYGMVGRNTFKSIRNNDPNDFIWTNNWSNNGNQLGSLYNVPFGNFSNIQISSTGKEYGSVFWAGLPIKLNFDPWHIEFEANYGYTEPMGRYSVEKIKHGISQGWQRASTERQGWLLKAIAEYKMDWGTPGVFGWYGSGDDGNMKNGSERMPFLYAETTFTSILGDATCLYGGVGSNDRSMSFSGSWGVGLQVKDISFVPKLTHLIRAAWVGGTNSTSMIKYAKYLTNGVSNDGPSIAWQQGVPGTNDYYLTTQDNLLEFNLHNVYDMYENFKVGLELGYVVNMIDQDLWKKADNTNFQKTDMWVVDLAFRYQF